MLRKLLTLLLVISMVGMSSGLVWDMEKLFTGRQMVPYGAGWYADDQVMYFGNDKNGYIKYDETTDDALEITCAQGIVFENAVVFDSTVGMSDDLTMAAGKDLNCASGASEFDWSLGTGVFKTPTGLHTFGGGLAANWDAGNYKITSSQFASDITTGTAPFEVASTTVVTNLNADKLDDQDGSYYGTASDVSALQARTYLHVQTITDPIVAAADTIKGATAINATGFTLAALDLDDQPDVPRTLSVSPNGALTGWVLFEGTNIDDNAITEYVNFTGGSSLQDTTKAFKTLTGISGAKTAGDDRSITIGQTDELGLDMTIDNDYQIMMVKFDGGIDATQTLVKDSNDVELNTIDIDGTLDSSKTIWVYVIVE